MATPQALKAVIRASKPDFKSTADKAAFAVHAILSVNGFSVRKVGIGVDEAALQGAASLPAEEADLSGWNREADAESGSDGGTYSFLYAPDSGMYSHQQQQPQPQAQPLLLLKCLRLSAEPSPAPATRSGPEAQGCGSGGGCGLLLVSLADVASGRPPVTLELEVDRYVHSPTPGTSGYEHVDELIRRVQGALVEALEGQQLQPGVPKSQAPASATTVTTTTTSDSGNQTQQQQDRERQREEEEERRRRREDPLRDERYRGRGPDVGLHTQGSPGWAPVPGFLEGGGGDEDLLPGGLPRPPGLGPLGGMGGGVPLGPRGGGGGMHVGPENPVFADRLRHPRRGPGLPPGVGDRGGAVPGMRWDPISPEGLQGWSPDDFTREGRLQRGEGFNDIGRPQPGRGPDWDHLFG